MNTQIRPPVDSTSPQATGPVSGRGLENPLSEREMDVARMLVTGASNGDIANELIISPHTVKVHLRNIYEKLAVNSRTEASILLVSQGWVPVPGVALADEGGEENPIPQPGPLATASGTPFLWQRFYILLVIVISFGLLLTPFFNRRFESLPNLLSDKEAMVLGRPAIADLPRWESRAPLGKGRSRLGLIAFNDTALYAIGGESAQGQPSRDVDLYDLVVNEWRSAAPLPLPLANPAVAVDLTRIFVAGGVTSENGSNLEISDRLFVYFPGEDRWIDAGRLPLALAGASLLTVEDQLYLLGGWDGTTAREEVWRIPARQNGDAQPADWQLITRIDGARAFAGAVAVADDLYIAGGYDGRRELDSAWVYNLTGQGWRALPNLATPRGGVALLYDGLALFAVGGGWTQPVDTIERFDPATGLWSNFPAPISTEWRHLGGAASLSGQLYLVGGWSGSYLDVHLRYQSSFRTFFPATQKDDSTPVVPPK